MNKDAKQGKQTDVELFKVTDRTQVLRFESVLIDGEFDVIKADIVFQCSHAQSATLDFVYDCEQSTYVLDAARFAGENPEFCFQAIDIDLISEPTVCELVYCGKRFFSHVEGVVRVCNDGIIIKVRDNEANELTIPMVKIANHGI
jgi:hypothetical protein